MKILTFGFEFPPAKNGGLGVACYGLTKELVQSGVEVLFVLPKRQAVSGNVRFLFADDHYNLTLKHTDVSLLPYAQSNTLVDTIIGYDTNGAPIISSRTILEEVHRFAHQASLIAQTEDFDIIHAHDWTSYLAGVAAKRVSGKPLVLHVHATSYDQSGGGTPDPSIRHIECEAFAEADTIITVSEYTKNIIINQHAAPPERTVVVYNGCESHEAPVLPLTLEQLKKQGKKIVLYHGRISIQKGVDYFVKAARKVVDHDSNVVFIISGWGDMMTQVIEQVGRLGLSEHVKFAGALWEEERDRMYQSADLVVMPSVSEPFGLVPLEALQQGTAAIISKQSGASEVLTHVLKVDFWDTDEMANQILSSLKYPVVRSQMVKEGREQLKTLSWRSSALSIKGIYQSLLQYVTP
jgi:glycosyltransferase involved in cell wall biosynthesis